MDEQYTFGQGLSALVPPKKDSLGNQSNDNLFKNQDYKEATDDALEEKISEKINNTFNNFPQEITSPLNGIKKDFQEDFQSISTREDTEKTDNVLQNQEVLKTNNILQDQEIQTDKPLIEEKIFYIEVEKIKPNPQQPRKHFPEESLKELADSIREFGILEPLVVIRTEQDTATGAKVEYELIAGERRLKASKMLGLPTVPVIIRKPLEEQKKLELALIENIQREDLTPISKAKAFARLIDEFGLTQQSLANRIGKSRESIANALRLLQLSYEAQSALEQGKINEGHARAILLFNNPEKRRVFLREILAKNLSGREALELAQHYLSLDNRQETVSRRRSISLNPEDIELKEKLENLLQTPVIIKKKGNQGAIEIKFFSQEDLNKILNKFFPL